MRGVESSAGNSTIFFVGSVLGFFLFVFLDRFLWVALVVLEQAGLVPPASDSQVLGLFKGIGHHHPASTVF